MEDGSVRPTLLLTFVFGLMLSGCSLGARPATSEFAASAGPSLRSPGPTPSSASAATTPGPTPDPTSSPAQSLDDEAMEACSGLLSDIPDTLVVSGNPIVGAAFAVTGEQLTDYFEKQFGKGESNGSNWWRNPDKQVDMCLFDGDFTTTTPGPPEANRSAERVLVVISDGDAMFWWSTTDKSTIPAVDPATIDT